ncbi:hypothetical protein CDD83_10337 [Cordyceps sp. RAO-2017]|nr:hypothetical protein CDD83_10337 [Cordyceps sp. RAO-2017]
MVGRRIADLVSTRLLGLDVSAFSPDLDTRAQDVLGPAQAYFEEEPTIWEWFAELKPTGAGAVDYIKELFPAASWMRRYNLRWLLGDLVAGITVGLVVVPQALAYAALADLPPAFGLYTSFSGAAVYWLFGTSRDVMIGTTAVGSLLVGQVIGRVNERSSELVPAEDTARGLSLMTGVALLFFGLLRLGWIIEFIPYIPISAFVTGASITIICAQLPTLLGVRGINAREAPYRVFSNLCRRLYSIHLDIFIGLSSLFLLFAVRKFCSVMEVRQPGHKRLWATISSLRMTFTMLLFTGIAWLVDRRLEFPTKFNIVGPIETGFKRAGAPNLDTNLIKAILPELPAVAVILVIEHIAIAKAMGRLYNYQVNPSQEIAALGVANLVSPFFGGYIATGSFGASAVLSKAGARSPLGGLFSAGVVALALYHLTGAFFFIPKAALSGLIVHAVSNLITPPAKLVKYWQLSPVEFVIWLTSVLFAIFKSLESSIYVGVALSFALLLFRIARPRGTMLGRARARRIGCDEGLELDDEGKDAPRDVFLSVDGKGATNGAVKVESPYPGIFIYRPGDGFNYINQAYHVDVITQYVMQKTKRMTEEDFAKESDRLWNDAGPKAYRANTEALPHLRALVLDFAAVGNVDVTSVQGLIDLRNLLDRHASPGAVEWHFANVDSRWTRRALAAAGFGYPTATDPEAMGKWRPVYSIAAALLEKQEPARASPDLDGADEEKAAWDRTPTSTESSTYANDAYARAVGMATVGSVDRPFFHVDLRDAVDCAVRDAKFRDKHMS